MHMALSHTSKHTRTPAELPSARLASLKAAHAHRLREPPRSLGDSTQRAWLHVRQRTYDFGRWDPWSVRVLLLPWDGI